MGNWDKKPTEEDILDEKVRELMYKRKITYQEAAELIKNGQKSIFEFWINSDNTLLAKERNVYNTA